MNEELRISLRVPLCCPNCGRVMKGSKSNISYYNFNCCYDCFIEFIEFREERWKSGWRPNGEMLEKFYKKMENKE